MLLLDGQIHHDTHAVPMGNYVIEVGNYVIATPSELGNYMSADTLAVERRVEIVEAAVASLSRSGRAGAACPAGRPRRPPVYFVVMHGPEGNEFCVG